MIGFIIATIILFAAAGVLYALLNRRQVDTDPDWESGEE